MPTFVPYPPGMLPRLEAGRNGCRTGSRWPPGRGERSSAQKKPAQPDRAACRADIAAVRSILDRAGAEIVLVGHRAVQHSVYLTALWP
jgi:hypothetical protein